MFCGAGANLKYCAKCAKLDFFYWHSKVASGSAKGTVNRMMVLLRYNFNLALEWETVGVSENPAKGVKPFQENNKIERYVSQEESTALKAALENSTHPTLKYIIALLLGCQRCGSTI